MKTNFLLGGAPKCGTTSLANYLRDHPGIFLSLKKEPFFFATDLPNLRRSTRVDTDEAYANLFRDAGPQHQAIGEASTLYLFSDTAIENALDYNPDMKFLFMLRHPVQVAHAFHMQMCFHEYEPCACFADAWADLPRRRQHPESLPERCCEARMVDYDEIAALGTQLDRAIELIPAGQLKVWLFDDFVADPASVYRDALKFLGVKDDGRSDFARANSAMRSRFPLVTRALRHDWVVAASTVAKKHLRGNVYAIARTVKHSLMFRSAPRESLPETLHRELHEHFLSEVKLIETLLDRDLSAWKQFPESPVAETCVAVETSATR
ncbi:MAG: hypothetical protein AAF958_13475 [Planctomycetota bacterium]